MPRMVKVLRMPRKDFPAINNSVSVMGIQMNQDTAIMDKNLYVTKKIEEMRKANEALDRAFDRYGEAISENFFQYNLDFRMYAAGGRRAELLKNPEYRAVLEKYR